MNSRVLRTPNDTTRLFQDLAGLDLERPWEVTWRVYKESKSDQQRAYFHLLLTMCESYYGVRMGKIKEAVKQECFGTDEVIIGGKKKVVTRSSEDANKDEYSDLIECLIEMAAGDGLSLPPPNTRYDEVLARRYK